MGEDRVGAVGRGLAGRSSEVLGLTVLPWWGSGRAGGDFVFAVCVFITLLTVFTCTLHNEGRYVRTIPTLPENLQYLHTVMTRVRTLLI